jgi:O-acetyl-ADP-ribose deacetylase (regulator of RNase III)
MSYKYVIGDLIKNAKDGYYDVIVHGCNCFNDMNFGIAATVRKDFPDAWQADQITINGDKSKLGTYTQATIEIEDRYLTVINAYTQYDYNGKKDLFEYDSFKQILKKINNEFINKRIGFPLIGCGLAGGNKDIILEMIKQELTCLSVTIVEYPEKNYYPKFKK